MTEFNIHFNLDYNEADRNFNPCVFATVLPGQSICAFAKRAARIHERIGNCQYINSDSL